MPKLLAAPRRYSDSGGGRDPAGTDTWILDPLPTKNDNGNSRKLQVGLAPDYHRPDLWVRLFLGSNMAASPLNRISCLRNLPLSSYYPFGLSASALARRQAAGPSAARDVDGWELVIAPLSGEPDQIGMSLAGRSFLD